MQYTSKPSRGLYTVSQYLEQSKDVLSNEMTSERCSRVLNVNAQVSRLRLKRVVSRLTLLRLTADVSPLSPFIAGERAELSA